MTTEENLRELIDIDASVWEVVDRDKSHATVFLEELYRIQLSAEQISNEDYYKEVFAHALYSYIMGKFELYIRRQFTEILNTAQFLTFYDSDEVAKNLRKVGCNPTIESILVDAATEWEPGWLISESMPGWHDPEKINQYFRVVFPELNLYSSFQADRIKFLWQIRHSIVHTGGLVTRFDARKHRLLMGLGDKKILMSKKSIRSLSGWLNDIVVDSTWRLKQELLRHYIESGEKELDEAIVEKAAGCRSPFVEN